MSASLIDWGRTIRRRPWQPLSRKAELAIAISAGLPVGMLVGYLWAPEELGWDGLGGVLLSFLVQQTLAGLSAVEVVVGLALRRRAILIDGALRLLLIVTLYDLSAPVHERIRVGWNFLRSLRPAYACHEGATCEDAVVSSISYGGAMALPACYVELVRLADPHGGRDAAIRVLRGGWHRGSGEDDESYAHEVDLTALGRGFYHAVICENFE